jgi:hypothetical protein
VLYNLTIQQFPTTNKRSEKSNLVVEEEEVS